MKHPLKSIVLCGVAAAVMHSGPALSQTKLGVRAGLSRATASGVKVVTGATNVTARTGLSLGVSGTLPLQDSFRLRVDGAYVQKGYGGMLGWGRLEFNLGYIEVAGMGLMDFAPDGAPASFYALAGPSLAVKTGCEYTRTGEESGELEAGGSCGEDVRGIDLGITGGVGAEMPFSDDMTVSAELRYTLGFMSILKDSDEAIKNRNLVLQIGVGFPIGD